MTRTPGDRRSPVRFEVFGTLWGTLEAGDQVRLRNLTHHGALIETDEPLAVESRQSLCLVLDGRPAIADAHVRHVEPVAEDDGEHYLVGVEFQTASTAFHEAVDRLVGHRALPTELR